MSVKVAEVVTVGITTSVGVLATWTAASRSVRSRRSRGKVQTRVSVRYN